MPTRHFVVIRDMPYKATGVNEITTIFAFLFDKFYFFEIVLVCVCICTHARSIIINRDLTINYLFMKIIGVEEIANLLQKIKNK